MSLIDLSVVFDATTPVYPGDVKPEHTQVAFLEKDGYRDEVLKTGMHVGTHMDAPSHMVNGGTIDTIPLERCTGRGVLIDVRGRRIIDSDALVGHDIHAGDVVLFWTDHIQKYKTEQYFGYGPTFTENLAHQLIERGVALVGLDSYSPDENPWLVHKILLAQNILILENLTNLDQLAGKKFTIYAFPPKMKAHGAPVRVVAAII